MRRSCIALLLLITTAALASMLTPPVSAGSHDGSAAATTFAIRAKTIHTMDPALGTLTDATIVVIDGKITAIGTDVDVPAGVQLHHEPDAVLIPGLVSASSTLPRGERNTDRVREDAVAAHIRAIDAYDPYGAYTDILAEGVTTAFLSPGTNRLISGQGAVVKLAHGEILAPHSHLVVNLGDAAFRTPPKQEIPVPSSSDVPFEPAVPQRPTSRLSQFAELGRQFDAARQRKQAGGGDFDQRLDALASAMSLPVRVDARRAEDLMQVLRHRALFPASMTLTGATEAHQLAEELAAAGIPIIVEVPFSFDSPGADRGLALDKIEETMRTAAALAEHDVRFAISASGAARPGDLMIAAMTAVRGGLSPERALAAITRDAADLLGVGDRVGSLTPGKDADILLLNGEPLQTTSHVRAVYINGHRAFTAGQSSALVIRAGTILTGDETIHGGSVLIEDGKIAAIGRTVPTPRGARVIDAGPDGVITPGFIDSHSHLGLENDRTPPSPATSLADITAYEKSNFADVAMAGVTTALVAPYAANRGGSQVLAMKTQGMTRDALVVAEPAAMFFSLRSTDPLTGAESIGAVLKKGQAYVDKWKKYDEALAKWKEDQAKKKEQAAKAAEQKKEEERAKEAEKAAESEEEEAEPQEEKKVDPISGTWELKMMGGPFPADEAQIMKLKLEEGQVTGTIDSPIGGEGTDLTGTFQGNQLELEMDVETPFGPPQLSATLEREDFLKGQFKVGDVFSVDFEATRTEKDVPEIKIKKRKKSADGRPTPPPIDPALEPIRAILAGEVAAMVDVGGPGEIDAAIKLFRDEYKLPLVLLNAEGAARVIDRIAASDAAVIVPKRILQRQDNRITVLADQLARKGVPVGFQSGGEDAARTLPLQVTYAVYHGMDAHTALRALTVDAARMFKIDDRVGTLAVGKDGDVLVFSGPPFESSSRLEHTIITGKEVQAR